MKVLHLGEKIYGGGAENVFYQTIVSLKELGQKDMSHFFAFGAHPKVDLLPHLDLSVKRNIRIPKTRFIYSFYNYCLLTRYLKKLQPDIIHLQWMGNLSPSILRALYKYKQISQHVKIVQTVHSFEHVCSHQTAYDYRKQRRCLDCAFDHNKTRIFYRFCSRRGGLHSVAKGITSVIADYYYNKGLVDCYICPSVFLDSLLKKRYRGGSKIKLIKNPIRFFALTTAKKTNTITYFGRLSEEKNLGLLIKALSKVLEKIPVRLRMIGDGPVQKELMELARREDLTEVIDFIPFVPHSEVSHLISDAKVFVLSSNLYETFSLVLYESIMAGLLPVVPAHGSMKEGVEWLKCGLLYESENCSDLSNKIITALTEYDSYLPLMKIAREKIINDLNVEKYKDVVETIYRSFHSK